MNQIIIEGLLTGLAVGLAALLLLVPFSALHRATNSL